MFDILAITINIGAIAYFIFSTITEGLSSFADNYVFIAYLIIATLTLPNLISKVIFNSKIVGVTTALSFLYYPIQYGIIVLIAKLTGLSMSEILPFGTIFNLILWNILFILFITLDEKRGDYSEVIIKNIGKALVPAILVSIFIYIYLRQQDSVVALDYLQHTTVTNKMFYNNQICITPNQCSNLFLQTGYTTFYHIILGNITTFIQANPIKVFYVLDLIWPLICSIPLYYLFKTFVKKTLWAQIGVLLSLLVFVTGAYEFTFFIPQTFAFLIFLMTLREGKLTKKQIIPITILLISIHFVMGTFLAIYLWIKYILLDNLKKKNEIRICYLVSILTLFFFTLANIAGFSIEKLIQTEEIETIGAVTNTYFPNNIYTYTGILGPIYLLITLITIANILRRKTNKTSLWAFTFLMIGSICYFLAPTYANKFTIGAGVFASILIVQFLSNLKLSMITRTLLTIAIIFIFGTNFYIHYKEYLIFYTQTDGTVSAITEEDMDVVEYLKENKDITYIVSDPYTQIIVAALANVDTANAQYMNLKTRQNLITYLENPDSSTYETLITSPGIETDNPTILYSSRLHTSITEKNTSWTYNIYSLEKDNSKPIIEIDKYLEKDMKRLGKKTIYISDYFVLFK